MKEVQVTAGQQAAKNSTQIRNAGKNTGKEIAKKVRIRAESEISQVTKLCRKAQLTTENIRLLQTAIAKLDTSVGDLGILQKAASALKDVPGAFGENGVFTRLIECGNISNKFGTARGAAYEIEKAYDLMRQGENIYLGSKIPLTNNSGKIIKTLDIDIETTTKIIECKNWDWSKVNDKAIKKFQSNLPELKELALQKGKVLELYSKKPIPNNLRKWLNKQGIKFSEG